MDDIYDIDDFYDEYDEEFSDEDFFEHELEDHEIISDDDYEYQPASIPPVPEDAGGPEIPPLATLSTAEALDDAIWAALPDVLVDRILTRLPPAAFARLRSVCKRWNELPSSPGWLRQYAEVARRPSCTVMCQLGFRAPAEVQLFSSDPVLCQLGYRTASFFCHSERNWFGMPPLGHSQEAGALHWELADVDYGLVCYVCYEDSGLWLCVSNPLTKAKTVLPPPFLGWSSPDEPLSYYEFVKLVVDRQSKIYKIVVLLHSSKPPSTLVYDSATALWTVLERYPSHDDRAGSCFLWKRTIFMPCVHPGVLQAFDVDTGTWREVEIEAPGHRWMTYHFVSRFDRFMIIRDDPRNLTKTISVLVLKDDAASPFPLFEGNVWVELDVHNRAYLQNVVSVARCSTSHSDCLIFTTPHSNQWITYTFKTRSWREMPSRSERDAQYAWYDWEPRWDVGTGPDPSPILNTVARGG